MAFNPLNYMTTDNIALASRAISGSQPTGSRIAAGIGLASSLLKSGSSSQGIAASAIDSFVDSIGSDFFSDIGLNIARTSKSRVPATAGGTHPQKALDASSGAGEMRFPPDLSDYYFALQFMDYIRPTPRQQARVERNKFIYLPIPRELIDGQQIQYTDVELGLVGSVADGVQIALTAENSPEDVGRQTTGQALGALLSAVNPLGDTATTVAGQAAGAIVNPNLSVAFKGPTLRRYSFSWDFSPNNAEESASLKKIINEIKKRALPAMTFKDSVGILSYPQMCEIKIHPNDLIKYKKSMIESVVINYNANGIPSFFKGTKEPVFIHLELSFIEIEYFLSEDFGGADLNRDGEGRGFNQSALNDVTKSIETNRDSIINSVTGGRQTLDQLRNGLNGG